MPWEAAALDAALAVAPALPFPQANHHHCSWRVPTKGPGSDRIMGVEVRSPFDHEYGETGFGGGRGQSGRNDSNGNECRGNRDHFRRAVG